MMNAPNHDALASRATRDKVAHLIYRYPNVSDSDAKTILTFLRKGRHLDVGILTADENLRPHLDRFMLEHAKHFRISVGEAAAVIAAIGGFLTVCWLIWEVMRLGAL